MPSTIIPPDYYATASSLFDYTSTNATLKTTASSYEIGINSNGSIRSGPSTTTIIAPPEINAHATVYIYGFCLILIPIATLLGNLLVIVSVLRFKALHSAINFLILGLAVADLLVAFLVMPYAVLVYVQGGYWFLGNLMCDIYSASDVACSTASILLLAVISFDRYRAVSRPIQYSRQSQNIQRVVFILIAIWLISILLASPIVFGINYRPPDANPYECRFYNPEFSIMSSFVSFVIPCFIVLFVYIRIMMALRKREKAAKARRNANSQTDGEKKGDLLDDEAGQIVAGPDDHDLAGSLTPRSSTDSLSENVNIVTNDFISEGPTSMSRRSSDFDSSFANNTMSSFNSSNLNDRSERSAISEHKRKKHLHNTFYFHRRSSTMPDFDPKMGHARSASVTPTRSPFLPAFLRQLSKRSPRLFRGGTSPVKQNSGRKNVYSRESPFTKVSRTPMGDISKPVPEEAIIIENSGTQTPDSIQKQVNNRRSGDANTEEEMDQLIPSTTDTETASAVGRSNAMENETPSPPIIPPQGAIISRSPMSEQKFVTANVARQLFFERNASIDENQELLVDCTVATTDASGKLDLVIENENAKDETPKHQATENRRIKNLQNRDECGSPSVSFNIKGKTFFGGREAAIPTILPPSKTPFERNSRRRSSCMENWSESNKPSESIGLPSSVSSNMISSDASIPGFKNRMFIKQRTKPSKSQQSIDSNPSISSSVVKNNEAKKKLLGNSKINGSSTALAVRIVKRTMHRKESSLKRKVTKAQRKERRATKTLGIVVGIFLICWVPFFTINILNAICVKLDEPSCQVGFGPFFYATWIGYMNSFMNPVIYTIFNTEFRRAFKSIILGRNARRHRARNV